MTEKKEIGKAGALADAVRAAGGHKRPKISAVIVAAGSFLRMRGIDKQFAEVAGIPVLARTLISFERCALINEIVVVARAEDVTMAETLAVNYGIGKLKAVVKGGATRALSAQNGFEKISPDADFVAIHDGARCLVTPEMIENVCRAAVKHNAATAAFPVTDTVKIADKNGFVKETTERALTYSVTTPQIFNANLYRAALATVKNKEKLTDDNQLIEKLPFPVKLVDCGHDNIKITYPEDLKLAEFLLKMREEQS